MSGPVVSEKTHGNCTLAPTHQMVAATATDKEVIRMDEDTMALAPVAEIVATGLPKDWETGIGSLKAVRDWMAGNILRYRHATGRFALAVSEERGKPEGERRFPGHTVHDIAVAIEDADSTVYSCMKFAAQTTPEQLEHLIENRWAWRAAAALVTVEDPKARRRCQLDYEAGKYGNSDAFKEVVREINEEAKLGKSRKKAEKAKKSKSTGGGRYIRPRIEGLNTVAGTLIKDTIPEFLDGLKKYRARKARLAPVTAENIDTLIAEARDNVDVLCKRLGDVRAAIDKLSKTHAGAKAKSED